MVPLKRSRGYDYSSDSDIESRLDVSKNLDNAWPRYLVVKRKEGEGFPSNPFLISKLIENVSKTINNVKRLRDGSLLVECPSKKVSDSFLGREKMGDFEVYCICSSAFSHRADYALPAADVKFEGIFCQRNSCLRY